MCMYTDAPSCANVSINGICLVSGIRASAAMVVESVLELVQELVLVLVLMPQLVVLMPQLVLLLVLRKVLSRILAGASGLFFSLKLWG